jgi:hypothetical protein
MKSGYLLLEDVADERGESSAKVARTLVRQGCDLYLHFGEARKSRAGVSFYPEHPTKRMEHNIGAGVHPLTKDSQEAVIKCLGREEDFSIVGMMVLNYWQLDDTEKVEYQIELMEQDDTVCVVFDSEDLKFLPPLTAYQGSTATGSPTTPEDIFFENSGKIFVSGKRKPHTAYAAHEKIAGSKRGDAWNKLKNLASESKGDKQIDLPGYGKIFLKRDIDKPEKVLRYKHSEFESPNDGETFNQKAYEVAWDKTKSH